MNDLSQPYEGKLVKSITASSTGETLASGSIAFAGQLPVQEKLYTQAELYAFARKLVEVVVERTIVELWGRIEREEYGHAKAAVALDIEAIRELASDPELVQRMIEEAKGGVK